MSHPQRRECYRVAGKGALRERLSVRLETSPGDRIAAEILDLCFKSIAIRVVLAPRPPLAIGSQMRLIFDSPDLERPVGLDASVHSADLRPERERYVLCFPSPAHLEALLPSKLFQLFNRRHSERGIVTKDLATTLHTDAGTVLARVENASLFGLGASVPLASDPELAPGSLVRAALRLSKHGPEIELAGEIARVETLDGLARYGIRIDADRTPEYEEHREALERFIARAGRERRRSARRGGANRRNAVRAELPPGRTIAVDLFATDDRMVQARMHDISASGMSVLVCAGDDPEFLHGEEMTVACRLARDRPAVRLVASVRRELLVDDEVCYGLEFDALRCADFERIQAEIKAFVKVQMAQQKKRPLLARQGRRNGRD